MRYIVSLLFILQAILADPIVVKRSDFKAFDSTTLDPSSFFEQFNYKDLSESNWKVSHSKKNEQSSYLGEWKIEEPSVHPGFSKDKGLVMKSQAAHHAISYKFDQPFNNTDKDLVLQYEIKLQKGLKCGGTYVKLLDNEFDSRGEFNNGTPYQIMFGPDKCGSNNKIHFIINRRDPITGLVEEKHLTSSPMSRTGKISTLYTLIFKTNSDFEIRINGEVAKAGNFLQKPRFLDPPLNPVKLVPDVNDSKPSTWDDREFIPAFNAEEKPTDYDEKYGSLLIPDPSATRPEGWNEDEPEYIEDPNAQKPDDWDDSIDGKWIAPEIRNPKCDITGCGKWEPPKINNPNYRGPWIQKKVKNPKYKGEWKPRLIPNPAYFEDLQPSNIELVGGLGFELWSLNSDILFDNIYLGHSIEEAETIGNTTFVPKYNIEYEDYKVNGEKAPIQPKAPPPLNVDPDKSTPFFDALNFVKAFLNKQYVDSKMFYISLLSDPITTLRTRYMDILLHAAIGTAFTLFIFLSVSSTPVDESTSQIVTDAPHTSPKEIAKEKIPNGTSSGVKSRSSELKHRHIDNGH